MQLKNAFADDYLFHEGDPAQVFYVVQRGAVNIHPVSGVSKEQIIHIFCTSNVEDIDLLSRLLRYH